MGEIEVIVVGTVITLFVIISSAFLIKKSRRDGEKSPRIAWYDLLRERHQSKVIDVKEWKENSESYRLNGGW
jgi:hypothetical protein